MELLFLGDSKPLENAWSAGHENMLNWMNKGYLSDHCSIVFM